jgi:hypothetical protein
MKLNKHGLPVLDSPQKKSKPKVKNDFFCRIKGCINRLELPDEVCFQHLMNMDSQSYWRSDGNV